MDYLKHYDLLISRAKIRHLSCYFERHHIIPKCLGGSDLSDNIVNLTPEEHFLAHQLLVKIHPGVSGLIWAAHAMTVSGSKTKRNNKLYGWLKRKCSEERSIQRKNKSYKEIYGSEEKALEISKKISKANKGKPKLKLQGIKHSNERINQRMSTIANRSAEQKEITRQKLKNRPRPQKREYTEEFKNRQSEILKNYWKKKKEDMT